MHKHLISTSQFSNREQVEEVFKEADNLSVHFAGTKRLITLFYQPSLRTRLSFEAAMQKLGGHVLSAPDATISTSHAKGESLFDAVRNVSELTDFIVLRHPERGIAQEAVKYCNACLINAGDGDNEHPTQALLDIYTIQKELGSVSGKHFAFIGDLRFSRPFHSLLYLLRLYDDIRITMCFPPHLALLAWWNRVLEDSKIKYSNRLSLVDALHDKPDVLYMTRSQQQGYAYSEEYCLDTSSLVFLPEKCIIMHPGPRNNEIDPKVDGDPRVRYYKQVKNGLSVRAAVISLMLQNKGTWA